MEKRAARSEATEKRSEKKSDPEARQKDAARRAQKREKLAQGGIEALEQWLKDAARLGLAAAQNAPASYWEEAAARMVDSQLPGAARMIREMGLQPKAGPDWAQRLLWRMGRFYLLAQAYQKLDSLPVESQEDVRGLLGWNVNQEELLQNSAGVVGRLVGTIDAHGRGRENGFAHAGELAVGERKPARGTDFAVCLSQPADGYEPGAWAGCQGGVAVLPRRLPAARNLQADAIGEPGVCAKGLSRP